jgi:hypothetical protein
MIRILIAWIAFAVGTLHATLIYSNTTNDTGNALQYAANGYTGIGDQISLTGTERLATLATTQFFNSLSTPGTFDAQLDLYNLGTGGATVGSLIGSFTVTNIAISGFDINNPLTTGTATVMFSALNVTVPDNVIFLISISNVVNADLGLTLFDPPTAGTSDNANAITRSAGVISTTPLDPGLGNVNFSLTAVTIAPEPVAWSMLAGGLALVALLRRRSS